MISSYETPEKSKSVFTEVYTQKRGTCITVVLLGIIIGIFAVAYITFGNESIADSIRTNNTLKFVSIIVQHGQTAPKFTYPNDLYRNDSRWQNNLGELSKRGKQNMHSLGKFFRERYSGLLPDLYFSSDIRILSSNADTCLMSAAVLLAGLYPPHKFQVWNPHVLWQPIPVKGISEEVDKMIDVTQTCPFLPKKRKQIEAVFTLSDENLPKLYDYLSENAGMEIRNLSSILALFNLFYAQDKSGLPLAEWTQLVYPEKMLKYAIKALQVDTGDVEITRLTTGVLFEKIISDLIRKSIDELSTKMFLFSTHEQSIVNVLRVLNMGNESSIKPEFSSSLMIELHSVEEKNIVQAFYLNKTGRIPQYIHIIDCGDPCLLDNFVKLAKKIVPYDWTKACSSGFSSNMFRLKKLIGLFVLLFTPMNAKISDNDTLVKTILLFRHGMRAPIKPVFIKDILDEDMKHWPDGYGKLVHNGKMQMFHLGQRLYAHYQNLVEPNSDALAEDYLQVVTTPVYRCYESAQNLLAGFFSLSANWTWSEAIEKQPVPISYSSPDRVNIIDNKMACPRYHELLTEALPDSNRSDIQYIRQYLLNHTTQLNLTSIYDVFMFIDYIKIKMSMNLEMPWWITDEYLKKLEEFFTDSFHVLNKTNEMIRLLGGPLIVDIIHRIREVIYLERASNKMFLYAGHDSSLHTLLKLMGHRVDFVPYFGASLIFEVHKMSTTDFRIKILYSKDYSLDFMDVLNMPGCEEFCPVGKFIRIVERFLVKDWLYECSLK